MKNPMRLSLSLLAALACAFSRPALAQEVLLETAHGPVAIELMREEAPGQVEAFLARVRSGYYDGATVAMALPGFGLQLAPAPNPTEALPPIPTPKRRAVARRPGAVGWSGDLAGGPPGERLFFALGGAKALAGHFGTFGQVTKGMEHLARMQPGEAIAKAVPPPPYTRESAFGRTPKQRP